MIDWARITELSEEIGAEDFDDVVALFLEEVDDEIAVLRAAGTACDLESKLHFLKGGALNLGFQDFSVLCQQGESAAAAGQSDDVDVPAILASYEVSRAKFVTGLRRQGPA